MNSDSTDLRALTVKQLDGSEHFHQGGAVLPENIISFWRWAYSNLAVNNLRGHLAEFLVASDLGAAREIRIEWNDCDLLTKSGIKLEIKSAAYLQSWTQSKHSAITFNIAPSRGYDEEANGRKKEATRNSKIYVFCLLAHKDKQTLDPTNLDQWEFYVLPTEILDMKLGNQKTLSFGHLLQLSPTKCRYGDIARSIDTLINADLPSTSTSDAQF